jgi:hypothetical protein
MEGDRDADHPATDDDRVGGSHRDETRVRAMSWASSPGTQADGTPRLGTPPAEALIWTIWGLPLGVSLDATSQVSTTPLFFG